MFTFRLKYKLNTNSINVQRVPWVLSLNVHIFAVCNSYVWGKERENMCLNLFKDDCNIGHVSNIGHISKHLTETLGASRRACFFSLPFILWKQNQGIKYSKKYLYFRENVQENGTLSFFLFLCSLFVGTELRSRWMDGVCGSGSGSGSGWQAPVIQ